MAGAELTKMQIAEIIRGYVEQAIADAEDWRATRNISPGPDAYEKLDNNLDAVEFLKVDLREALAFGNLRIVRDDVIRLLEGKGLQLDPDSDGFLRLSHEMIKVKLRLLEIERMQLLGDYSYQEKDSALIPRISPREPEKQSEPLSVIIAAYWKENVSNWKPRSQVQYKGIEDFILGTLGHGTPIHEIDYQTGRDFKSTLMKKTNQSGKPLSKGRVALYLNYASGIWNWAMKNYRERVTINPFSGLQPPDKKKGADELRDALTVNDLKRMFILSKEFGQDEWGRSNYPHFFYIPLIALFTGCRLEEICQLTFAIFSWVFMFTSFFRIVWRQSRRYLTIHFYSSVKPSPSCGKLYLYNY